MTEIVEANDWLVVADALEMARQAGILAACACRRPQGDGPGTLCGHCQILEAEDALTALITFTFALSRMLAAREGEVLDPNGRPDGWLRELAVVEDGRVPPRLLLEVLGKAGFEWGPGSLEEGQGAS